MSNKVYDLINILLEDNKYGNGLKKVKKLSKVFHIKEYKAYEIMEHLNTNKLNPYQIFEMSGYLSSSACLEIPTTYLEEKRLADVDNIKKVYENGKVVTDFSIKVLKNDLPPCIPKGSPEGYMTFLYNNFEGRYNVERDKDLNPIITDNQKYIPVLLGEGVYHNYKDTYVKMRCFVLPLNDLLDKGITFIDDEKYNGVMSYFVNLYAPKTNFFILVCEDVLKKDNQKNKQEKINFVVEYEILEYISNRQIVNDLAKLQQRKYTDISLTSFGMKGNHKVMFLSRNQIYICVNDKNIGFTIEVDLQNNEEYMYKLKQLEQFIKNVFSILRWKTELIFISDYRKKMLFNKDFRYKNED